MKATRILILGICTACAVGCGSGGSSSPTGTTTPPPTTPPPTPPSTVATPTFAPAPGTYSTTQLVTISDTTAGATIFYTTDGGTPTASSAKYAGALSIKATTTVKALATAVGDTDSAVATGNYTISIASGHSYTTAFPFTENPLSDSGNWINGDVTGLLWGNVQALPGLAFGTILNLNPTFNDSTAVLSGAWGPNQTATGTVHLANANDGSSQEEVELRLNTSIAANSITGYEFDASVIANQPYLVIVRWNGPVNSFCYINTGSTCSTSNPIPVAIHDGDVLKATNVNGTLTFYVNGVAQVTATDTTYTSGAPGIGFWNVGGPLLNLGNYGFSSFSASDIN